MNDILLMLEMFPAFWAGGALAVFIIGSGIQRRTSGMVTYFVTLTLVSLMWPITTWFMVQKPSTAKLGPWDSPKNPK